MAEVHLWSGLRSLADGKEMVEVPGATVGQVLDSLVAAHPGLEPALQRGVSVAVDGQIVPNSRNHPVDPDSEIFLLQKLAGG
ncbi:MoaD/ThiS family protein [Nioella nitratireducens]|uniref:MoaD/ThiS family protein n=1 Tax=Nioella nitratireducens TaxID=1287720 RepID=UPI0008FD6655|nr:MoaD/ThiS family protein [Nioella nitratireducens]